MKDTPIQQTPETTTEFATGFTMKNVWRKDIRRGCIIPEYNK